MATAAKQDMLEASKDGNKEGVIFRDTHASYRPGRTDVLRKHKFVKEIDAVVVQVGKGGKSNAVLGVYRPPGELHIIGQVSTIGKGPIAVGDVLEIQYLYHVNAESPILFQPRIIRVRGAEKPAAHCTIDQLGAATDRSV